MVKVFEYVVTEWAFRAADGPFDIIAPIAETVKFLWGNALIEVVVDVDDEEPRAVTCVKRAYSLYAVSFAECID